MRFGCNDVPSVICNAYLTTTTKGLIYLCTKTVHYNERKP